MKIYLVNVNLTASGAAKKLLETMKLYLAGENMKKQIIENMKLYLAGGYSGNLKSLWDNSLIKPFQEAMKIYLVNPASRQYYLEEKVFKDLNILESYYYLRKAENFMKIAQDLGGFLLDSGAFTFLKQSHQNNINWDEYIEDYGRFINKYDIKNFFELDIDTIVGLKEVERLRERLEKITNKKCIPVWHKNRGKDYFLKMCDEYPYIALGGIAIKEIPIKRFETLFPWFINEAHKRGAKIHGLGYTHISKLKEYHFDSVDSTAWLHGNRSGYLYKFNPRTGLIDKMEGTGGRLKSREGAINNFCEWWKFSKYAELYL